MINLLAYSLFFVSSIFPQLNSDIIGTWKCIDRYPPVESTSLLTGESMAYECNTTILFDSLGVAEIKFGNDAYKVTYEISQDSILILGEQYLKIIRLNSDTLLLQPTMHDINIDLEYPVRYTYVKLADN